MTGTRRRVERTGHVLADAIAVALVAAYEDGRADSGRDEVEQAVARRVSAAAIAEVQRLLLLLDIERGAAADRPRTATR